MARIKKSMEKMQKIYRQNVKKRTHGIFYSNNEREDILKIVENIEFRDFQRINQSIELWK